MKLKNKIPKFRVISPFFVNFFTNKKKQKELNKFQEQKIISNGLHTESLIRRFSNIINDKQNLEALLFQYNASLNPPFCNDFTEDQRRIMLEHFCYTFLSSKVNSHEITLMLAKLEERYNF